MFHGLALLHTQCLPQVSDDHGELDLRTDVQGPQVRHDIFQCLAVATNCYRSTGRSETKQITFDLSDRAW